MGFSKITYMCDYDIIKLKGSMLLCKESHAYVNKLLMTKPVLYIRDSKSSVNYQNYGLCIWGLLKH